MKKNSKNKRKIKRSLKNTRFSVELEVEFPNTKDSEQLIDKHRIIRGWTIDRDGSLDNGAEYRPSDKNHLFWKEDCFDQIKEIIGLIKAHRGKVKEKTCGLHVHVDGKLFTSKEIVNIIRAFILNQKQIFKRFKIVPSRKDYAQKIPKDTLKILNEEQIKKLRSKKELEYDNTFFGDRHYALNAMSLNKHGSLEFRLFGGSLKINKIKEAIKFSINFCIKHAKG